MILHFEFSKNMMPHDSIIFSKRNAPILEKEIGLPKETETESHRTIRDPQETETESHWTTRDPQETETTSGTAEEGKEKAFEG